MITTLLGILVVILLCIDVLLVTSMFLEILNIEAEIGNKRVRSKPIKNKYLRKFVQIRDKLTSKIFKDVDEPEERTLLLVVLTTVLVAVLDLLKVVLK